jgi:hypothetical protein
MHVSKSNQPRIEMTEQPLTSKTATSVKGG